MAKQQKGKTVRLRQAVLTWFICLMMALPAGAAITDTIQNIEVEGTKRVDEATVKAYLGLYPGDDFAQERVNTALKDLFSTGMFSDIRMLKKDQTLIVQVAENPVINQIAFEGNKRLDDDILGAEVQLKPRTVYTRAKVQEDVSRILELYRRSGRFAATVEPKLIEQDQNRVDLVFEINEGDITEIRRIAFVGNKQFSDGTLRSTVQTAESAWYRILSNDDTYDPDRLEFDKELLRRFYLKNGYADFRVVSAVAELSPDSDAFYITFTVDEGNRYKVSNVNIHSAIQAVDVGQIQQQINVQTNEWYDARTVEQNAERITDFLGDQGYAFVDVDTDIVRDRSNQYLDLTFQIREGPKVFVEKIDVNGNVRTLDRVVRREFELAEGDAFNTTKLRKSERKIRNLGFFEGVDVKTIPGSRPDSMVIDVDVAEQSTGELSFGAGFSTQDKVIGDISIRERNLLGRGQDLKFSTTMSARTSEFDIGFTEPYFLERELLAGVNVYRKTRENQEESSYDEKKVGTDFRFRYLITEDLSQQIGYGWRRVTINDIAPGASRFIFAQEGTSTISEINHNLFYDKRDSRFSPSNGYFLRMTNDLAGLGGTVKYFRTELGGGYYVPLAEEWILSLKGTGGYIQGLGGDGVRLSERFFLGGDSFRGFARYGVGPRDTATDDALGGNIYAVGNAELTVPLGLDDLGIQGALFSDVGTLTEVDDSGVGVEDTGKIRLTAGFGVLWRSPIGPIRVDLATPIIKEEFDEEEAFRFSFGTRF